MTQYIPNITEEDVDRILNREFSKEHHEKIKALFKNITINEKHRVIVACFKIANKDIAVLINQLSEANGYWREIISAAEYPKIKKSGKLTTEEINIKMKNQYLKWLK